MRLLIIFFLLFIIAYPKTNSNFVVKIAVLQAGQKYCETCKINNPGPESHFNLYANLARQAAKELPEVIVFPEYVQIGWPYLSEEKIVALAENIPGNGYWFQQYLQLARELGIAILGNMVERSEKGLYNTAVFLNEKGELIGKYRKVHANLGEQTRWGFSQGKQFEIFEYRGVKYGFSICSDMWFPETVRVNELLGADIVIHQSIADDMGHIIPTRAFDSKLPIVAAIYQGGGYAVNNRGILIGKMDAREPAYQIFEIKPFGLEINNKYGGKWIPKTGRQNLRNLDAYLPLLDPALRPPWTEVFLSDQGHPQTRKELLQRFNNRYDKNDPAPYFNKFISFPAPWTSPYRIDPKYPHHFVNKENHHLFLLNKTAWAYLGCSYPEAVLKRAKAQGINVLRVALEGKPYYNTLGIDMWPWGGTRDNPDWSTLNEIYWREVERRIELAGKQGIGFDLCIYFTLKPKEADIVNQQYYWQTILERLGKYSNIFCWEIQNEYIKNKDFQDAAGVYFKNHDPYHRPVITSDGTTDDAVWPHKSLIDMAVNHTCTGSNGNYPLDSWYLRLAKNTRLYGKPAFCNESGREGRHKNDDGVHRRKQGWLWTHAGCYWTWHSWDGCEGIDSVDYVAPGGQYIKPMADYFASLPFWKLNPNYSVLQLETTNIISAVMSTESRDLITAYLCIEKSGGKINQKKGHLRLPDGEYRLEFINPSTLNTIGNQIVQSKGLRRQFIFDLPTFTNDLLIKIVKTKNLNRTLIPGTK